MIQRRWVAVTVAIVATCWAGLARADHHVDCSPSGGVNNGRFDCDLPTIETRLDGRKEFEQTFEVFNSGPSCTSSAVSEATAWLSVAPTVINGLTPTLVTVSIDLAGLPAGHHEATITVKWVGACSGMVDNMARIHVAANISPAVAPAVGGGALLVLAGLLGTAGVLAAGGRRLSRRV